MVSKLNDEQLDLIAPAFDVLFWNKKFKQVPADAELVKDVCKEAGIQ